MEVVEQNVFTSPQQTMFDNAFFFSLIGFLNILL